MDRRSFAIGALATAGAGGALAAPAGADALWAEWLRGGPLGRADALLVVQDGRTAFERYGADHGPTTPHVSWSMAKSFTTALAGMAVGDGKASLDAPLRTLPKPHPGLTLRRLLNLTDGLDWNEAAYSVVDSDATKMLYGPGRLDGAAYTAAKRQAVEPGRRWNYSTGAFQLAAAELQAALFPGVVEPTARRAAMAGWIRQRLFDPLGMTGATAEFDAAGGFYGGSLVYATARDYARFGQLHLQDGVWEGRRLLPEGWVKFCRTPTVAPDYGAGFWLESTAKPNGKGVGLMGGAGPLDAFSAEGHDGQVVMVVPSQALVVVRLGKMDDGPGGWTALGDWMARLAKAYPRTPPKA